MLLDITTQLPQVLLRGIMPYEARCQLRSGVIDHPDQIELLAPPFQPVVFTSVPLHQLAITRPPGTPYVSLFDTCSPHSPQLGLDQPPAQRLAANRDPIVLGQLFGRQRRTVVMPQLRLLLLAVQFHGSPPQRCRRFAVRRSPAQPM